MRRGLIVFAAAIAIGFLVAIAVYFWKAERSATSWLLAQFALDDQQARTVERMHNEYQMECTLMCARIAQTDEKLAKLIGDAQQVTPEIQSAIVETDRLRSECRVKMLEHFYRIAAELPEERRAEYLRMVLPVVLRPGAMEQSHIQ
jgi:Heavy-metal resistance